jgi:hypothetical protein
VRLVGLTGFAGAGKDEVAKFLVREHGFTRVAFADPLREMLYALNPVVLAVDGPTRVQNIVDAIGWDSAKRAHPEIRQLLQRLGTEAGRKVLGEQVWTDLGLLRGRCARGSVVFTDCRFENECQRVVDSGGEIWRVVRPGVAAANGHASEAGVPDALISRTIDNSGTLTDLGHAVFGALTT